MGSLRKKNDPELFVMEEEEMFDIDYEWQFQAAEKLYEVKTNKLLQSDVGK
jgi:CMP-N-acetylneuraminic acid synthetase